MEASADIFGWLSILWERGFLHDNPHGTSNLPKCFLVRWWKFVPIIHVAYITPFQIFAALNGMFVCL